MLPLQGHFVVISNQCLLLLSLQPEFMRSEGKQCFLFAFGAAWHQSKVSKSNFTFHWSDSERSSTSLVLTVIHQWMAQNRWPEELGSWFCNRTKKARLPERLCLEVQTQQLLLIHIVSRDTFSSKTWILSKNFWIYLWLSVLGSWIRRSFCNDWFTS